MLEKVLELPETRNESSFIDDRCTANLSMGTGGFTIPLAKASRMFTSEGKLVSTIPTVLGDHSGMSVLGRMYG